MNRLLCSVFENGLDRDGHLHCPKPLEPDFGLESLALRPAILRIDGITQVIVRAHSGVKEPLKVLSGLGFAKLLQIEPPQTLASENDESLLINPVERLPA